MNPENKEMTALNASVGADAGQPIKKNDTAIIHESEEDCNTQDELLTELREWNLFTNPNYLHTLSMNDIYDSTYEQKPGIVDGLLYPGTYLFVGAPKLGKSFFMAQLAYHVSTGTPLWDFPVRQADTLYLALEDDYGRLQRRLAQMFDVEGTDRLRFATAAKQLGQGLDGQLEFFLSEYPKTKLVIIDTLQKVRDAGGEAYSYSSDYDLVGKLKALADKYGLCLLLVHHTRKQKAGDHFDMVSGTNGLMGAADGAFLLQKDSRISPTATLEVCGRDQQDRKLHLIRDMERLCWKLEQMEGEDFSLPPEPLCTLLSQLINANNPSWSGTATELTTSLGMEIKPNILTRKLNVLRSRLLHEHHINCETTRERSGRRVTLTYRPTL